MWGVYEGIDPRRRHTAIPAVGASRRAQALGARTLTIAACYLAMGVSGAWAIRSVVEARPVELLAAWLMLSVVVASLWSMRPGLPVRRAISTRGRTAS